LETDLTKTKRNLTRREAEQQVPLKLAQDVVTFAAEWMRITVAQFLLVYLALRNQIDEFRRLVEVSKTGILLVYVVPGVLLFKCRYINVSHLPVRT
jgi:hypothetical protein